MGTERDVTRGCVLVVDDDRGIVDFLQTALIDEGYRVCTAPAEEAVEVARVCQPAVILLDLLMPRVDGVEVGRRLRADPATKDIPIVVMSAPERVRVLTPPWAPDDVLLKPFHFGDMYATVARWMHGPMRGAPPAFPQSA